MRVFNKVVKYFTDKKESRIQKKLAEQKEYDKCIEYTRQMQSDSIDISIAYDYNNNDFTLNDYKLRAYENFYKNWRNKSDCDIWRHTFIKVFIEFNSDARWWLLENHNEYL